MRATSCLVLILGLSLLLAGGCGGGSEAASVLITLPCPNDANWDHHLAGPLAEPMSASQSTYGTARVGMAGDGSYVLVYRVGDGTKEEG